MKPFRLNFVTGDTLPVINGRLKNDNGDNIDITGFNIKLHVQLNSGALIKIAEIVDAVTGKFKFVFNSGDLPKGAHRAEIEVTDAAGGIQTAQKNTDDKWFIINVEKEIL
mgnify:CR=1 FL=1